MYSWIRWIGVMFFLPLAISCVNGEIVPDGEGTGTDEQRSVTIQVGTQETSVTRAFHGDENAMQGEFIHSLHLFIVNEENRIEKHIHVSPENSGSLSAEDLEQSSAGNLPYYSTSLNIQLGRKFIYAFANMEQMQTTEGQHVEDLLKGLAEGDFWNTSFDSMVLDNPMSVVAPEKNGFIPMSVRHEEVITNDGQRVALSLIRLVSRIRVALTNSQGDPVQISKLSLNGLSSSVSLLSGGGGSSSGGGTVSFENDIQPILTLDNNTRYEFSDFYINETIQGMLTISMVIDGKVYQGALSTESVPRNHILPIALQLSGSKLHLTVSAQVAPIGGYPVTVALDATSLTDRFVISLPEGCAFRLDGMLEKASGERTAIQNWHWQVSETSGSLVVLDGAAGTEMTNGGLSVSGWLTAMPGQDVELSYTVIEPVRSVGVLRIQTVAVSDSPWMTQSRLVRWEETPIYYEQVSLKCMGEDRK